ncbi:MAG TPA: hypothetical protein VEV20_01845 [Burkholderiales bacterium]|nr:hypothetical protein [Burkholderiales bacterium]
MAARACLVSFRGPTGVVHGVEVEAESLYEAAALGIARLRADGWCDQLAPGTPIEVRVTAPATTHTITLAQLRRWTEGVAASPDETLRKSRMKALIA